MNKTKLLKDKITQLQKQVEQQKESITQRDTTLEKLMIKMDSIIGINQEKTNEIDSLKNELKHYQEQVICLCSLKVTLIFYF